MVTINVAYTAPINPAGATPVLTQDQVWRCLERKVEHAEEFVKVITTTEVLSKEGVTTVRRVKFVEKPDEWVEERCVNYKPTKVRDPQILYHRFQQCHQVDEASHTSRP